MTKGTKNRKDEILDVCERLFMEKGFDETSITDIVDNLDIARGTLYYHFDSKESMMDALLERNSKDILKRAENIASDKSIPLMERLIKTIMALNVKDDGDQEFYETVHKPQNALMHEKMKKIQMEKIPPILANIIEDGMVEGIFSTPYPLETMELVVAYVNAAFDDNSFITNSMERNKKITGFIYNLEILLKTKPEAFQSLKGILKNEDQNE